jgi:pyridoxamine 5'-phosphate oxidase
VTGFSHPDRTLERDDLSSHPMEQFRRWFDDAEAEDILMPNAIALATADAEGRPSVRHVLLRGFDEQGFVFYTNRHSRKALELAANPHASIVVHWKELDRQVSASGGVALTSDEESDAYFATRPRDAQIGAWASAQSQVLGSRRELDDAVAEADRRFEGIDVPRPAHWGGYRLRAHVVEFWQGRAFRLHDRLRYIRDADDPSGWRIERLAP